MHQNPDPAPRTLAVISAGTSDPSTTTMLATRLADRAAALAAEQGLALQLRIIDLRALAADVMTALVSQHVSPELQRASDIVRDADALVVSTPVYKAGPSGLFTAFFQVLDNDLLIGTPVALAATAGSARHALVVDEQLRGLFAYLRTITVPTALFAAPEDWNSGDFGRRIDRAATELVALVTGGFRSAVRGGSWDSYQHSFGSAGGTELGIDLDSDLMRLATGGR
ncbi:CE1759 family FMN reductase [Leucobacter massiliensis]|uniref:NADH-dependent FMN reductase n=1 Tax=Leucobacter massiliensis TaxID=1686285 RepID=A0A2S9QLE4_9MICO|nr:CE1759 family FMN reductase [Leucobacter massiliensis]PRI10402.1 NADH-dependent FMN reductase [Leucobacter massiliensis]